MSSRTVLETLRGRLTPSRETPTKGSEGFLPTAADTDDASSSLPASRWNECTIASRRVASLERSSHVLSSYASNKGGSRLAEERNLPVGQRQTGKHGLHWWHRSTMGMTKQFALTKFVLLDCSARSLGRAFKRLNVRRGLSRRPRRCRRRYQCRRRREAR